jgi:hypothetical protein
MLEGPPSLLRRGEVLWGLIPWQLQRSNRKQRRPQPTAVMHVLLIGKTWLPAAVCVGVEDQALELRARGRATAGSGTGMDPRARGGRPYPCDRGGLSLSGRRSVQAAGV